ncbi:3-hydroxyisobutyryl-CoA hydrolase-like protein 5 [Selaginella moellendorffii]|uniref:3-hydroxyisobutyryl-CoA hydrolase-like protein 5 n=1 Tax=Selaginella moellendorffii TaxID=88036 RepID=UPI000D1CB44B|nr:3-hydroxyisobutyryl-CoA hydrolase-like protein 5 [Selaginella moellendorffii]|eukprot:XP_024532922.1 3-hydroxyisobutyryl-CoA hydrolase-like protein 5 [Selaginella moellendorffii]
MIIVPSGCLSANDVSQALFLHNSLRSGREGTERDGSSTGARARVDGGDGDHRSGAASDPQDRLSSDFYSASCPNVESIVTTTMNRLSSENNVVPIGMLRLLRGGDSRSINTNSNFSLIELFSFAQGCDASILLTGPSTERAAMDNLDFPQNPSTPWTSSRKQWRNRARESSRVPTSSRWAPATRSPMSPNFHDLHDYLSFAGEYLALTGSKLDSADMLACGIATHFVPSKDVPELEKTLLNLQPESSIQEAIQGFAKMPEAEASSVMKRMTWINNCFSKDRVEEIIESLASTNDEWCKETARSLRRLLPIALKQALASIRQGRTQSLKKCLEREQRITLNCLRSLVSDDLYEGIRAVVVDKDRAPKWNPSTLAEVTDDMVEMILNTYTAREQIQLPLEDEERWSGKYSASNSRHFLV